MHKGDIDAVDAEPLETIFDRSPNTGRGVIEDDVVWRRREREVLFAFGRFRGPVDVGDACDRLDDSVPVAGQIPGAIPLLACSRCSGRARA